jgi:uncharacterized protein YndB with AHSA1/START domain
VAPATDPMVAEGRSEDLPATLNLRRTFQAPRELVWLAWTNPGMIVRWLGPVEWPAASVTQDLRVGGAWSALLKSADGDTLRQSGTYRLIEPPHRLVFTFAWGEGHEDGAPVETLISVTLTALSADETLMEFTQAGLKSEASAGGHRHGWTSSFGRLDDWLANQREKEKSA